MKLFIIAPFELVEFGRTSIEIVGFRSEVEARRHFDTLDSRGQRIRAIWRVEGTEPNLMFTRLTERHEA